MSAISARPSSRFLLSTFRLTFEPSKKLPVLSLAAIRFVSAEIWSAFMLLVPSSSMAAVMEAAPGRSAGSFAQPLLITRFVCTSGTEWSSTTSTRSPLSSWARWMFGGVKAGSGPPPGIIDRSKSLATICRSPRGTTLTVARLSGLM